MEQPRLEKTAFSIYALFVYTALIVDFYRKFSANVVAMPISVNMFRNLVYVVLFFAIIAMERRTGQWLRLILIGVVFTVFTVMSCLINWEQNAISYYIDLMFMFVSRLLPAYYVGTRLAGNEEQFVAAVNRWQWLTVLYMALIVLYPETSEASYLTISGNILLPALIGLMGSEKGKKHWLPKLVGLAGVAVILIYGGRTYLVAVVLAVILIFLAQLRDGSSVKKAMLLLAGTVVILALLITYEDIIAYLYKQNPTSRTLRLLAKGEFFWASNRNDYYNAAYASFMQNPFRVYGFLGDRFYYYDTFNSIGGNAFAITMFSHNTLLELMLNFGVPIGAAIIGFFIYKMAIAVKVLGRRDNWTASKLTIIIFASAFAPLFLSSSWLNDYMIWLLAGAMLGLANMGKRKISA